MYRIKYFLNNYLITSEKEENDDYKLITESSAERTTITIVPKKKIELVDAAIRVDYVFKKEDTIFSNGYQSWSDSKEFAFHEKLHSLKKVPKFLTTALHLNKYGDYDFIKYSKAKLHSFTYAYIRSDNQIDLIGSLNEENAYLIIHFFKNEDFFTLESECKGRVIDGPFKLFDYVRYQGEYFDTLKKYFEHFGSGNVSKITGYSSWYNDYQNITEEKMLKALSGIDKEHYDLFQVDDGYETFVGDWLEVDSNKFPNGLKPIVDKVHEKGLKAGIWLAPFVVEVKSKIYQEHHDWIYQENGKDVFAGCNWSGDVVLDLRKQEVLDYIKTCLEYYVSLGFDFFKLDFLYAAAIVDTKETTKAEMMRKAMKFLREVLKGKLILGCGVPLSSAFNLVDYCRIGPDVSLSFDDAFYMRLLHRERVSTKVTLQNTIYRHAMDGYVFGCDPDVYLLRDDNIKLTPEQKKSLLVINSLFGSVYLTSDNVSDYNEEKKKLLEDAKALYRAKVTNVKRLGKNIYVEYVLDAVNHSFIYNTEKGVISEWK